MRKSAAQYVAATMLVFGVAGVTPVSAQEASGQNAPIGITLEKDRQTITSALRVDLTRDFATMPLYKGTAAGETVWYVITDVSDENMARQLGINHAPKLRNAPMKCPACVQEVETTDPVLGKAPVKFQGAPDFSPTRTITAAPMPEPFPPQAFTVGAQARANYSPYVRTRQPGTPAGVEGSDIVFNAPIVATGDGPFDITTHANTHDRALGIDTAKMTTDLLFVRGFSNGRSILYLSFDSSDAFTATIERSTFVPGLIDLGFANGGDGPARVDRPDSARASIFTFVNGKAGLETSPPDRGASQGPGRSQGLTHALSLPIAGRDAAVANADVLDGLRRGADVSNIFSDMPSDAGPSKRLEYSPAWDLQVGVFSDAAMAAGRNGLQTNSVEILRLAADGVITSPGKLPLGSGNIIINCPALAFLDEPGNTVPDSDANPATNVPVSQRSTGIAQVPQLPRTGSAPALLGLLGVVSIAIGGALRTTTRRREASTA